MNTVKNGRKMSIRDSIWDSINLMQDFVIDETQLQLVDKFVQLLIATNKHGGTVFFAGNGGSHADALHAAEELTGRFRKDRTPLAAVALGETTHMSCVSNDYGFVHGFDRQLQALARENDLLVVMSTSGNSQNLLQLVQTATKRGMCVVGLLGKDGGLLKPLVDLPIVIPSPTSDRAQELHMCILHSVIEEVERVLFPENY